MAAVYRVHLHMPCSVEFLLQPVAWKHGEPYLTATETDSQAEWPGTGT